MSLELTSKTNESSELFYEQISTENQSSGQTTERTNNENVTGRTDRNLESKSNTTRTTAQKANIAFKISFRIPLQSAGLFPTQPGSC